MQPPNVPDQFEIPQEVRTKPAALVGFAGLDTINNAIHKSIWEAFHSGTRRIEGPNVSFVLIDNAHEFPVIKPKRNSYEWYIPKGIIKRNWMNKYLKEVPAVVVVFYDLDWNDIQWNEKMIECASRVQSIRAALEGRNTKIAVILIQGSHVPAGEDLASERVATLSSNCEINSKSLFVLPHSDHLQGYAIRLVGAFFELAQNFYHFEAKNVKAHREHLNKTNHQYLFVRHQFKVAFLSEMRQDLQTAHKHYTFAYNNLLEVRIVDTNAQEIRTVAGFINYKLCQLMFSLNLPRDAISQFRLHIDKFKTRIGFQELAFEHHAWLSKQYSVFGDLFDAAVKMGLPAVQIQHPGLYYQQGVQQTIIRRELCEKLCSDAYYPSPDPLQGITNLEFYGQRPWRPGKLSAEPPDPVLESNGIKALQFIEKTYNHSNNIITLYGLAISQYKTYKCSRTRNHLVVQMADEYYKSRDYGKSLTLLTHMLCDYRNEKWWTVLSNIIQKALRCAYLTASVQDYIILILEILGETTVASIEYKKKMYDNLCRILNWQVPDIEIGLPIICAQNASSLWQQAMSSQVAIGCIDVRNISMCLDCKAKFMKPKYQVDENIAVEVYMKSLCAFPFTFPKVYLHLKTVDYKFEVESRLVNVVLYKNEVQKVHIEFLAKMEDIDKDIQISSVILAMNPKVMELKFSGYGDYRSLPFPELQHFRRNPVAMLDFDNIRPQLLTTIVPRRSKLKLAIDHEDPALLGEWYEVKVKIKNEELHSIQDLLLEVSSADSDGNDSNEITTEPSSGPQHFPLNIKLKSLVPLEETVATFYMRMCKIGDRNIICKVTFILNSDRPMASMQLEMTRINIVKPFEISVHFMSLLFENISTFHADEEFVIMPTIICTSPWPLVVEETRLNFDPFVKNVDGNMTCQISGMCFKNKEIGSEIYLSSTERQSDKPFDIGEYCIKWKRLNGHSTITKQIITGLSVDRIPLNLKMTLPEYGLVRTPLLVQYHFYNKSQHLIQMDVNMDGSEAFMFAGYKQFQMYVLPESEKILEYNLYPLIAGSVVLPKLKVTIPENSAEGLFLQQEHLDLLIERTLPKYLYIMPQAKGNLKSCEALRRIMGTT